MLLLLSPAKKLDYDTPVRTTLHTQPLFVEQAAELIEVLREKSVADIASLMSLSDALAELNVARYAEWEPVFDTQNARQAVLAFNGDVYEGLQASELSDDALEWAQEKVLMLSGLYGVLRPLDLMRPYRLEMGTRLKTPKGANLYAFWGSRIAEYLNSLGDDIVVNLASEEYFKAVDKKALKARVIQCVFQEQKGDSWKVVSFYAKKARGLMARHVIDQRIQDPEGLKTFAAEGYVYAADASTADRLVFRR
ncbi:peroxide stress protein YaaA [Achromobacter sp. F4_2707]|uniref:peroxide stress protein YaaA n=1 Tax=Achromobacter sp. F4_2707 TaxID=3114286 RepID=UPI0039C65924